MPFTIVFRKQYYRIIRKKKMCHPPFKLSVLTPANAHIEAAVKQTEVRTYQEYTNMYLIIILLYVRL